MSASRLSGQLAAAISAARSSALLANPRSKALTKSGTPLLPGKDLVERTKLGRINYNQNLQYRTQRKQELITEVKRTQLKPVKRITFKFDPFHDRATSCREYLFFVTGKRQRATNPECNIRTEVIDTREDPTITVELENGQKLLFVTPLLTTLEIAKELNRVCSRLYVPPEEITAFKLKGVN